VPHAPDVQQAPHAIDQVVGSRAGRLVQVDEAVHGALLRRYRITHPHMGWLWCSSVPGTTNYLTDLRTKQ
jgi:hypothetical protein